MVFAAEKCEVCDGCVCLGVGYRVWVRVSVCVYVVLFTVEESMSEVENWLH